MPKTTLETSTWAAKRPGLADAARGWLGDLDDLLLEAHRRANKIVKVPPIPTNGLLRVGELVGRTAPRLVPALLQRDGEDAVAALADAAVRGGPTFVKLGQLISSTKGLAPDWLADAFAGCRDAVPPASSDDVQRILDRSGLAERIRSWDHTPIASASVAQVHAAVLDDGTDVVLKVRRPGIVRTVASDMQWLLPVLRLVESRNDRWRVANLSGITELMGRLFAEEVDLRLEVANIAEMALAFERSGIDVQVPVPIPGMVAKRVFAMERIEGFASASPDVDSLGHHAADLVRLAMVGVLETTLNHGVFHGDLHAGNVIITPQGLALVDFGIVGRLSLPQRRGLLTLLVSALSDDREGIVRGLEEFGALPKKVDASAFLAALPTPPTEEERSRMLHDQRLLEERISLLVRALGSTGFRVSPELTLFAKNLVYLGDAVMRHAPDMDAIAEASQVLMRFAASPPTD